MSDIFAAAVESVKRRGFHEPANVPDWMGEPLMMTQLARLVEEAGEVARSLRKGGETTGEELADVVIVAAQIAHLLDVDLNDAIIRKLAADEGRGHLHNGGPRVRLIETEDGLIGGVLVNGPDLADGEIYFGSQNATAADVVARQAPQTYGTDTLDDATEEYRYDPDTFDDATKRLWSGG